VEKTSSGKKLAETSTTRNSQKATAVMNQTWKVEPRRGGRFCIGSKLGAVNKEGREKGKTKFRGGSIAIKTKTTEGRKKIEGGKTKTEGGPARRRRVNCPTKNTQP